MALGTAETSPMKMAEGYAVFANGGYHVLPYYITRIENANGDLIYQAEPPRACSDCWYRTGKGKPARTEGTAAGEGLAEQVIDPRIAYQMTSMMRGVVEHGTGTRALRLRRSDIVGKTGTTNDVRDSWFCGFQADYVTVAWMGFDSNEKLGRGEEGGRAALSLWTDYMEDALQNTAIARLELPPGMVKVRVDGKSGTETKSGDATEAVMEEYRLMLMGPDPTRLCRSADGTKKKVEPSQRPRTRSPRGPRPGSWTTCSEFAVLVCVVELPGRSRERSAVSISRGTARAVQAQAAQLVGTSRGVFCSPIRSSTRSFRREMRRSRWA